MSFPVRSRPSPARILTGALILIALISTGCYFGGVEKTDPEIFSWTGALAAPGTLRLRNINGPLVVTQSTDGNVHFSAAATWHKGNPKRDMTFQVVNGDGDVTICALWGSGVCSAKSYHTNTSMWNKLLGRSTDASIVMTVQVPASVKVDASTVNGDVTITATAPVHTRTINGSIKVGTAVGPVDAQTVNGDVDVRMTTLAAGTDMVRAESVTGSATAWLPDKVDATVSMATVAGSLNADYGIVTGKNKATATLGNGGREVVVKSVTGSARVGRLAADGSIAKP